MISTETIVLIISLSANVVVALTALVGLVARYCYLSKCPRVSCCWSCLSWERDIRHELTSMEQIMRHRANAHTHTSSPEGIPSAQAETLPDLNVSLNLGRL